ncbi:MAG: hypothetical protein H6850_00930 [Alphaproteobacteria bacterium]|nr:MAG: hypothetical protein H6850_00930 [Alphaproteobacteria bacterium]
MAFITECPNGPKILNGAIVTNDGQSCLVDDVEFGENTPQHIVCCNGRIVVLATVDATPTQHVIYVFNNDEDADLTSNLFPLNVGTTSDTFKELVCCGTTITILFEDSNSAYKFVDVHATNGTYILPTCSSTCWRDLTSIKCGTQDDFNKLAKTVKLAADNTGSGGGLGCDCTSAAQQLFNKCSNITKNQIAIALANDSCDCNAIATALADLSNAAAKGQARADEIAAALKQSPMPNCSCQEVASALLSLATKLFETNASNQDKANIIAKAMKNVNCCCQTEIGAALYTTFQSQFMNMTQELANLIAMAMKDAGCTCTEIAQALAGIEQNVFNVNQIILAMTMACCTCKQVKDAIETISGDNSLTLTTSVGDNQVILLDGDEKIFCCVGRNDCGEVEHYFFILEAGGMSSTDTTETQGAYQLFVFDNAGKLKTASPIGGVLTNEDFDYDANTIEFACCYRVIFLIDANGVVIKLTFDDNGALDTTPTEGTENLTPLAKDEESEHLVCCNEKLIQIIRHKTTKLFAFSDTKCWFGSECHEFVSAFCCDNGDDKELFVLLKAYGEYFLYLFDVSGDNPVQKFVNFKNKSTDSRIIFANSVLPTATSEQNYLIVLNNDGTLRFCQRNYAKGHVVDTIDCCELGCDKDSQKEIIVITRDLSLQLWLFVFNFEGSPLPRFGFPIGKEGDMLTKLKCCGESASDSISITLVNTAGRYKLLGYNNKGEAVDFDCKTCTPERDDFNTYAEYYQFLLDTKCACRGDVAHLIEIAKEIFAQDTNCSCASVIATIQDLLITRGLERHLQIKQILDALPEGECNSCLTFAKVLRNILGLTPTNIARALKASDCSCSTITSILKGSELNLNLDSEEAAQILKDAGCTCEEIFNSGALSGDLVQHAQTLKNIGCPCQDIINIPAVQNNPVKAFCCDLDGDGEKEGVIVEQAESGQHTISILADFGAPRDLLLGDACDELLNVSCCDINRDGVNEIMAVMETPSGDLQIFVIDGTGNMTVVCPEDEVKCDENRIIFFTFEGEAKIFHLSNSHNMSLSFCPKFLRCVTNQKLERVFCCNDNIVMTFKDEETHSVYFLSKATGAVVFSKTVENFLNAFCCTVGKNEAAQELLFIVTKDGKLNAFKSVQNEGGKYVIEAVTFDEAVQTKRCDLDGDNTEERTFIFKLNGIYQLLVLKEGGEVVCCPTELGAGHLENWICCAQDNGEACLIIAIENDNLIKLSVYTKDCEKVFGSKTIGDTGSELFSLFCCGEKIGAVLKDGAKYTVLFLDKTGKVIESNEDVEFLLCDCNADGKDEFVFYYKEDGHYQFLGVDAAGLLMFCPVRVGKSSNELLEVKCCANNILVVQKNSAEQNKLFLLTCDGDLKINGEPVGHCHERFIGVTCCDANDDGELEILVSIRNKFKLFYLYAFTLTGKPVRLYELKAQSCDVDDDLEDEIVFTFAIGGKSKIVTMKKNGTFLYCPQEGCPLHGHHGPHGDYKHFDEKYNQHHYHGKPDYRGSQNDHDKEPHGPYLPYEGRPDHKDDEGSY